MGNKVSTARKLDSLAKNSKITRSDINQLPNDVLKQKYQSDMAHVASQGHQHQAQPHGTQSQEHSSQSPPQSPETSSSSYTGGRSHQPTTFQSSVPGTPPGKDGFDPQGAPSPSSYSSQPDQNSDFMKIMNQLGKAVTSEDSQVKLTSDSINQLKNRKRIDQSFKDKQANSNTTVIDSKILTTILLELNDTRYTSKQVLTDYNLDEEDLSWLNRFKVPNNYRQFQTENKDGDINHEPIVRGKTLIDEELKRDDKRNQQNQINSGEPSVANTDQNIDSLKKRLSLDD